MPDDIDNRMICLGPAHYFREAAERIDALLAQILAALEATKGRRVAQIADDVAAARSAFAPIVKGFRGEYPEPPKRERPALSAAQRKSVEALAKVMMGNAAGDTDPVETTH